MNTHQSHSGTLPTKNRLLSIYIPSLVIAALMTIVSIAGIKYHTLIYPNKELSQAFVPNDVVNLLIGLPILLISMWLARHGKWIGLLCWAGALFFTLYSYLIYVFAMPVGWAFLGHLLLVMLSAYTLIRLVVSIDGKTVQQKLAGAVPERFAGAVLAGLGSLFLLRAIGVIASAFSRGVSLAEVELATSLADFLTTPAWIIGGILLWRRRELGYVTGLGLLFQASMLFIALIAVLLLQPILQAAPLAVNDIIVVSLMGLVCFVPFVLFARGVMAKHESM